MTLAATVKPRTRKHFRHEDKDAYDCSVRLPSECKIRDVVEATEACERAFADWRYANPTAHVVDLKTPMIRVVPFGLMVTIEFSVLKNAAVRP